MTHNPNEETIEPLEPLADIVVIPADFFWMGSKNGPENETPRQRVWLHGFGIGRFPVTNRGDRIFVEETGAASAAFCLDPILSDPDQPVVENWNDATAYCQWLSEWTGTRTRWAGSFFFFVDSGVGPM